jgi:hypothetical protein
MSFAREGASSTRRALAVFVDFCVYFTLWGVLGSALPVGASLYVPIVLVAMDVIATAYGGFSPGRLLTGIRVGRVTDDLPPGLRAALLRTALVVATGWLGMLVFLIKLEGRAEPPRMWWDTAARTRMSRASHADGAPAWTPARSRPKPFGEWSFSGLAGVAFGILIVCLFSLTNGQPFPGWMLIGLLVLAGAGLVATYGKNTYRDRMERAVRAPATVAVILLGIGIVATAKPADAIVRGITIADVMSGSTRGGGPYYELTATDGTYYSLPEEDFQPSLPQLDSPRYRGDDATLTLDRGTTGVLAIRIDGLDYVTAAYTDPNSKLIKGVAIGGLVVAIGAAMAVAFGYLRWLGRVVRRE